MSSEACIEVRFPVLSCICEVMLDFYDTLFGLGRGYPNILIRAQISMIAGRLAG